LTLYVDTSALLKSYVDEADSEAAEELIRSDPVLVTGRHTLVEVRRNLARRLDSDDLPAAREVFARDLAAITIVELDVATCEAAAAIAELLGVRTLDALHLAAAQRVGSTALSFATFDLRQAQAARSLGLTVLGA
jgi:predicted nucleic acid-binding protein